MAWAIVITSAFRRDYRRLSSEIQRRVGRAIEELGACEDPRELAHRLHGRWEGLHSYEIGLQYRMIFRADVAGQAIEFLAVGTHKIYR